MFTASKILRRSLQIPKQKYFLSTKPASLEGYGAHVFKGAIAKPYLEKQSLPADTLDSAAWTTNGNADKVQV